MKRIVLLIVCVVLLVLDNTILPYYSYEYIFPSLLFTFAIGFSIINGKKEAVIIGVLSGFLQDVFFFQGFGINMFLNMLLCYLVAKIGEGIYKENRIVPVITCLFISVIKVIGIILLLKLFSQSIRTTEAFISAVLNSVVLVFIYKIILNYSKKYFLKDTWRIRW